jgi:polyisoprenoid-binding protein YceI
MTITTSPQLTTGTWTIDAAHSEIGFTVRHLGVSKVRGRFNTFSGSATIGDMLADSSLSATIDLSSVDTNNEQRDGHLRGTDFFDIESNPRMVFRSTSIDDSARVISGELTINGVTKEIELEAALHGVAVDAYGTTRAGISASTQIKRSDFGIDFNVPLDAGGVLIGDKVTVELEIQLVPAEG